ncbi:MAG: sigma-70 family RNA polymerase sigma factor, partial [Oscillospiraceae bacterium]|nr:sigma-70 family RNA polymerase sigma factor [Oscillospiraceae bacterium]
GLAVVLVFFRGQDRASTAEILNIPVGTVKSRLNKARKLLKEVLADETDLRF